jgi:hypothetical protein
MMRAASDSGAAEAAEATELIGENGEDIGVMQQVFVGSNFVQSS